MDEQPGTATTLDSQPDREAPGGHAHLHSEPVPHVQPLSTELLTSEQLNQQISETFSEIIKFAHDLGQSIATEFGLTGSDAIALFKLEAPMTMKELGQKMGCDPSFVTTVADALEKHGLARREPSLRDRRSKNIVLTPEGVTGQGPPLRRTHGPGTVVHRARHRRAPVPARTDAQDAQIPWWEVMVSQPRRLPRQR